MLTISVRDIFFRALHSWGVKYVLKNFVQYNIYWAYCIIEAYPSTLVSYGCMICYFTTHSRQTIEYIYKKNFCFWAFTIFKLFSYKKNSNIFLNILKAPLFGMSWKTEIYWPEDLRAGCFSILQKWSTEV